MFWQMSAVMHRMGCYTLKCLLGGRCCTMSCKISLSTDLIFVVSQARIRCPSSCIHGMSLSWFFIGMLLASSVGTYKRPALPVLKRTNELIIFPIRNYFCLHKNNTPRPYYNVALAAQYLYERNRVLLFNFLSPTIYVGLE